MPVNVIEVTEIVVLRPLENGRLQAARSEFLDAKGRLMFAVDTMSGRLLVDREYSELPHADYRVVERRMSLDLPGRLRAGLGPIDAIAGPIDAIADELSDFAQELVRLGEKQVTGSAPQRVYREMLQSLKAKPNLRRLLVWRD